LHYSKKKKKKKKLGIFLKKRKKGLFLGLLFFLPNILGAV